MKNDFQKNTRWKSNREKREEITNTKKSWNQSNNGC